MSGGQNRSTAVMARCHDRDDLLNYFPTQPWATRALCEFLKQRFILSARKVWEPACGEGHMSKPLSEYFLECTATDVEDYSATYPDQDRVLDFLLDWGEELPQVDWIITNPPFVLAQEFIDLMLARTQVGCAIFVRTAFLEGMDRYNELFSVTPPAYVLQFAERVPLVKGRLDKAASTATAYCWIVWLKPEVTEKQPDLNGVDTLLKWIKPCRRQLEREGDYPSQSEPIDGGPLLQKMEQAS